MEENTTRPPVTAVDRIADGGGLQMAKAAVPYLPVPFQRPFSVYIKLLEVGNVLSYYRHPVTACAAPERPDPDDFLSDIRAYCTDSQRQALDQAMNLINTLKLYQDMAGNL